MTCGWRSCAFRWCYGLVQGAGAGSWRWGLVLVLGAGAGGGLVRGDWCCVLVLCAGVEELVLGAGGGWCKGC